MAARARWDARGPAARFNFQPPIWHVEAREEPESARGPGKHNIGWWMAAAQQPAGFATGTPRPAVPARAAAAQCAPALALPPST